MGKQSHKWVQHDGGAVGLEDKEDINKEKKNADSQLDLKSKGNNSIFYCKECENHNITKKQCGNYTWK